MIFKLNYYIRIFLIGIVSIVITSCTTQIDIDELDYFYVDRYDVLHINRKCKNMRNYAITPISRKEISDDCFIDICSHCIEDEEYSYIKVLIRIPTFLRGSTIEERQRDLYEEFCERRPELMKDMSFNTFLDAHGSKFNRQVTYDLLHIEDSGISQEEFSNLIYKTKEFSETEILANQQKLFDYLKRFDVSIKIGSSIYEFRELLTDKSYWNDLGDTIRELTNRTHLTDEAIFNAIYYNKYDEAFD